MDISAITGGVRKFRKQYLSGYSGLVFLLGIFLIGSIWMFVQYQIGCDYNRTITENSRETMNLAKAFEEHVRRIMADADKDLLNLKQAYERDGIASPVVAAYTENGRSDPTRNQVAVSNEHGTLVASFYKKALEMNIADREYFNVHRSAADEGLYIGKPIQIKVSGKTIIPLTRRIDKPDGTFGGVVFIGLCTDYFLSYYQTIELGDNQLLSLSGTDGYNRARQAGNSFEADQNLMEGDLWKAIRSGRPSATTMSLDTLDGVTRITSYRVMPDYPLIVTVGKSTKVAMINFERRKEGYIAGASLASLFILAFCGLLASRYTRQRTLNNELSRLERLNLVGEMAAGIGHEIRNPLTTVRGYLQWFLHKGNYPELKSQFRTMIEELDRANGIITEYLSLSKKRPIALKQGNINDVLDALFPLLQGEAYSSGHDLEMKKDVTPDIYIDGNELRQLVLNLVRNGFDAMQPGGVLTVKSYAEKGRVILAVCDTGKGISQDMLDKLGTPFLTTKDNGTGLGLAVCYQIAARHAAKIDVETSPEGTTFYIKFKYSYWEEAH